MCASKSECVSRSSSRLNFIYFCFSYFLYLIRNKWRLWGCQQVRGAGRSSGYSNTETSSRKMTQSEYFFFHLKLKCLHPATTPQPTPLLSRGVCCYFWNLFICDLFLLLIQIQHMQTLSNPIVYLHGLVVFFLFFLPYANVNLTVLLWCLCAPASFRGVNPLTLPFSDTVNTSGFRLWNNGCLMLMLWETDYVIIPQRFNTKTHTHMCALTYTHTHALTSLPSPAWLLLH